MSPRYSDLSFPEWSQVNLHSLGEILAERINNWKTLASEIIIKVKFGNVGLVAETGAGKTVIAILAMVALGGRWLFLVPQRILAQQHQELINKLTGGQVAAKFIIGSEKKRDWQDSSCRIYFATPHVFLADAKKGAVDIKDFDFIVFDEFHKATGDYPYVKLAQTAIEQGKSIIALSASPGGDLDHIEEVARNLKIESWVLAQIASPPKEESLITVELGSQLSRVEELITNLVLDAAVDLEHCGLKVNINRILGFSDLERLKAVIDGLKKDDSYYDAVSAFARYYKARHMLQLAVSESYQSFLDFYEKLKSDKSKSAKVLIKQTDFCHAVTLAREHNDRHPKIVRLLEIVTRLKAQGKNCLIFVGYKDTGRHLVQFLSQRGVICECLFGGSEKNPDKQKQVLDKMRARQLDCIIATSVIEEGISVPEVDVVLHYSMPLTEISRLQRGGRTGRIRYGQVIFLSMDHPLDKVLYWATRSKLRRMKDIVKQQKFKNPQQQQGTVVKSVKYKGKIDQTLPLC